MMLVFKILFDVKHQNWIESLQVIHKKSAYIKFVKNVKISH